MRRLVLGIGMAAVMAASCKDSDAVTGLRPTPVPTPVPIAGSWVGTFDSDHPVLCVQTDSGTSIAQLVEAGTEITGSLSTRGGGCGFNVSLELTRSGNDLSGTATEGTRTAPVSGTLSGGELTIAVQVLSDPTGYVPGGRAVMHRP